MRITDEDLEEIIVGVLIDCTTVNPPLDRNEIAQHVLDQLSSDLRKRIYASLDRMVGRGRIVRFAEPGAEGRHRYDLSTGSGGRH